MSIILKILWVCVMWFLVIPLVMGVWYGVFNGALNAPYMTWWGWIIIIFLYLCFCIWLQAKFDQTVYWSLAKWLLFIPSPVLLFFTFSESIAWWGWTICIFYIIGIIIHAFDMLTGHTFDMLTGLNTRDHSESGRSRSGVQTSIAVETSLEEEEHRKDRQLRDLQIEQLLNEKVNKEKIAAKKKITRKSPQTLLGKKEQIDKKLKDGLITERTAVIQTNKAIAAEKMRLIIENQRKEKKAKSKTEPKKPASTSTKEFEYVEKLNEIKSLREEGVITQAEFGKLKKKIIDSL